MGYIFYNVYKYCIHSVAHILYFIVLNPLPSPCRSESPSRVFNIFAKLLEIHHSNNVDVILLDSRYGVIKNNSRNFAVSPTAKVVNILHIFSSAERHRCARIVRQEPRRSDMQDGNQMSVSYSCSTDWRAAVHSPPSADLS